MFDLVVENAKIVDGTGNPSFRGDIGIRGGKIARVGRRLGPAAKRITAEGLVACPGFIDSHSHIDQTLRMDPAQTAKLEQGITLSVAGQCGSSWPPAALSEYLRSSSRVCLGASVAILVGHGALRIAVMRSQNRAPSLDEMKSMKDRLRDCLESGALGISFGLIYPPSSYAEIEEMVELCKVVAEYDGVFSIHMRNEGTGLVDSFQEALDIARLSGCRGVISHHKAMRPQNWGKVETTLQMIDRAVEQGIDIWLDAHPYTATSAGLRTYIPQAMHALGMEHLVEMLGTPEGYQAIEDAVMKEILENRGGDPEAEFERAVILMSQTHPEYAGRRIIDIAREKNTTFMRVLLDTLREDKMRTQGMHLNIMCEEDVRRVLAHPRVMIGTDGGSCLPGMMTHPRTVGTFPRFLGRFVRDQKLMTIEQAVMKTSSLPARVYGFSSLGLIHEGFDADIVVFDEKTIIDNADFVHYDRRCDGLKYVIVGGEVVVVDSVFAGPLRGRVLLMSRRERGSIL